MKTTKQLVDDMYFAHQRVVDAQGSLAMHDEDGFYHGIAYEKLQKAERQFDDTVRAIQERFKELEGNSDA